MRVSIIKTIVRFSFVFVLLSVSEKSWGQLLQWNTFGNIGTETSEPSVFNNANITSSNLTFGAGVTPSANGNRFGGNAWFDIGNTNPTTLAESVADNDYIQFIVTPNAGTGFTLTSFVFFWDRSSTGPSSVTLRSSVDGFSADLGTVTGMISGGAAPTTTRTITISGLNNLSSPTTFRLYGYEATNAAGTGGFDNASSVVNVQLYGTTCTIPATPTISAGGPTTFCSGGSVTLTSSSATGNQWYQDGSPIGGETNQTYVANTNGTFTVVVTEGGCNSAPSSGTLVTVTNAPPTPTINYNGFTTFCSGSGSLQLSTNFESGIQWFFNGNPISTNPSIIVTAAGSYTAVLTQSGCPSAPSTAVVITHLPVPPTPTITPGVPTEFCSPQTVTLTSSSAEGNQWYVDGFVLTGANSQTYIASAPGSYTVVVTAGGCPSSPSLPVVIIVNPQPTFGSSITEPTTCSSTDGSIQLSPTGAPGPYTFVWTGTGIVQGAEDQNNLGVGSYSVTITINATNCSQTLNFQLTGPGNCNACPDVNQPANQNVCNNAATSAINFSGSFANTIFTWTNDNSSIGLAANGTGDISSFNATNTTTSPVTATITVTPTLVNQPCNSGPSKTFTITVFPGPVVSITGGGLFCGGATPTLSATPGMSSYSWTRFAFAGVLGTDPTLVVTKSGSYHVAVTNSFGCGTDVSVVVQTGDFVFNGSTSAASSTMANRLLINNSISTCAAPKTCSVSPATGPFAYNLHTLTNPNPDPVCAIISADIQCTQFMNVSAYLGSFNPANICTNYLGDMGHGLFGGTIPFEVMIPGGATIVIKVTNTSSGSYCNNYELVVDIPRVQPGITVSPDVNICEAEQVTLTASPANSYLWSSGGATTQSITVSPATYTTYTVQLGYGNQANCTVSAQTNIFVSSTPTVAATPMTQTICSGETIIPIDISSNSQYAQLEWERDHVNDVSGIPGTGNGDIMGSLTNITNAPITVTFTIRATANFNRGPAETEIGNCSSQPIYVIVIVNPNPNVIAGPSSQTICSGNVGINVSGSVSGTVFNWTRTNNILVTGLPASGNSTGDILGSLVNTTNAPLTITFTITPTFTNAGKTCSGIPATVTVIVKPMPDVIPSVLAQGICNNQTINSIAFTGSFAGTQFNWTRNNTGLVTGIPASGNGNISGSLFNTTNVNQRVTFTIIPSLDGCSGTPVTVTVDVSPAVTGVIQLAPNNQLCAGQNGGMLVSLTGRAQFNGAFVIKNLGTNATNLYIWTSSLVTGLQNILIPATYIPNGTGSPITYKISWHSLFDQNGCTGMLSGAANITVYPRPILMITDPPPGNTCTGNGLSFVVNEYNNLPGSFAVVVTNANNQVISTGSNLPFGNYRFDAAGCSTPGPLTFTFSAIGLSPLSCPAIPVVRSVTITDIVAPVLNGTLPGGNLPNSCAASAPAAPTQAAIRALYTDNCTSQAALIIAGPVSNVINNGCTWTKMYTFTITDGCGNSATAVVTYTGSDTQGPSWSTAAGSLHRTISYCDIGAFNNAQVLQPQATDNCSNNITVTKTNGNYIPGPDCFTSGTITNTFIATDGCENNSIVFTQVITVVDTQGPTITATNQNTLIGNCSSTMPNVISLLGITAVDCFAFGTGFPTPFAISYNNNTIGNNMIWQSPAPGSQVNGAPGSIFPVTVSARDDCGNTSNYVINMQLTGVTGSISGTAQVQQNAATSSLITFTGAGSSSSTGTQQYLFNYSRSINGAAFVAQGPVTTIMGQNSISVTQSHASQGTFAYRLDGVTDLTTNCNGTIPGNNTATITVGTTSPIDFTPIIASSPLGLSFPAAGVSKDFFVGVINLSQGLSSSGQVILRIVKSQSFSFTFGAATTVVFGTPVQNNDWIIDNNGPFFVVLTLKPGITIPPNGGSLVGFTVTRNASVAPSTIHHMTTIIQSGSGGDSNPANNATSMTIMAQ